MRHSREALARVFADRFNHAEARLEEYDTSGAHLPSADMIAICLERAATRGLQPVLHQQMLQTLDLPRRYRTIFVACGALHLVIDRAEVVDSLRRLHDHLLPRSR